MQLLLACSLAGCGHGGGASAADSKPAPPPPPATSVARSTVVQPEVRLPGLIAPSRNVTISSALTEPALTVRVKEGDVVHRGEILAQLDTTDQRANLAGAERSAAEADLRTSQQSYQSRLAIVQGVGAWRTAQDDFVTAAGKLKLDHQTLVRDQTLAASGFIPQSQLDQARSTVVADLAALRSAKEALRQARATVGINGDVTSGLQKTSVSASHAAAQAAHAQATQIAAQIEKATIRSPIDGVVVDRNFEVGEYPGTRSLFTLQDTSKVYAVLNATSSQLAGIRPGAAARIAASRSAPGGSGVVEAVLGQPNPGATTFTVKVLVPNPQGTLRSGMPVIGSVRLAPIAGTAIPTAAFVDAAHTRVAVSRGGVARLVPVRELSSANGEAIVTGIRAGERVVTNGASIAGDGQRIAPGA
ncbi:MAG TPA: efflux RND transporter periplasmic adaptor subunit [Candidatus Acidoferrum sp.]|nr:efflux RND transporter periplasmic adaptor subunit [Candidatus Acidoferrum sp.]